MDVAALIERMRSRADYAGQLAHVEVLPERPGRFAEPRKPLADTLTRLLAARGIEQLYSHQCAALEAARAGRDFVVTTGTASGKTLCYNLPILEAALADPSARALYLFPDQGAGAGSAQGTAGIGRRRSGVGGCHSARRLRRRHADRAASSHSRRGQSRAVESRHAARLGAAVSSEVGVVLFESAICRHRRSPHVSRDSWAPMCRPCCGG